MSANFNWCKGLKNTHASRLYRSQHVAVVEALIRLTRSHTTDSHTVCPYEDDRNLPYRSAADVVPRRDAGLRTGDEMPAALVKNKLSTTVSRFSDTTRHAPLVCDRT